MLALPVPLTPATFSTMELPDPMAVMPTAHRFAEVIIAETNGDMSRFASAKHLASWASVCPGHHESAGRTKSARVRSGNPYLKGALGVAAFGAVRTKDTYLQAGYSDSPPAAPSTTPGS